MFPPGAAGVHCVSSYLYPLGPLLSHLLQAPAAVCFRFPLHLPGLFSPDCVCDKNALNMRLCIGAVVQRAAQYCEVYSYSYARHVFNLFLII